MKKTLKRVLSVLIVIVMQITVFSNGQYSFESKAAEGTANDVSALKFEVGSGETESDGIVEIPVRISNNSGIKGFYTKIFYDSNALTPIEVKKGSAFDNGDVISNLEKPTPGELNVVGYGAKTASNDGVLYTVVFKASDTASGSYELKLSYDPNNTYDAAMNEIVAQCANGSINITKASVTKTSLYITNQTVVYGEHIQIPIKIKNRKAVKTLSFKVKFDSDILQPLSVNSDVAKLTYSLSGDSVNISVTDLKQCNDGDTIAYIETDAKKVAQAAVILSSEEDINAVSGIITIQDNASSKSAVYASNIVGEKDSTVAVSVCIKNNPGISGYKLKIGFDSEALTPQKIEDGISYSGEFNNLGRKSNEISVIWINHSSADVTENGELFTVYFKVLKEGVHNVSVTYSKADTFNSDFEEIDLTCTDGKVFAEKMLFPREGKSTVIDTDEKYIYGLDAGLKNLNSYLYASEGYSVSEISGKMGFGTMSKINVMYGNDIADTYTVIIFGDVNGDGLYDGQDAVIVGMIANGMLTREQVGEAAWMAADCNHDGVINQSDVDLLDQAGVLLSSVDQTKSANR